MDLINYLLDVDLVINLFILFSKKLPWKDALLMTLVTVAVYYIYITFKSGSEESS